MMTDRVTAAAHEQRTKPGTVRLAQSRAATALINLLTLGGPVASWTIGDPAPGALSGRIGGAGDDTRRANLVRDWAARLDTIERWEPYRDGVRGRLVVDAVLNGVEAQVWAPFAVVPDQTSDERRTVVGSEPDSAATKIRRSQRLTALALTELLSTDSAAMPAAWWYVPAWEDAELEGHIRKRDGDHTDRFRLISAWADVLRSVPRWREWPDLQGGEFSVTGTVSETPVEVWTWLPGDPAQIGGRGG
ncbi:hypothetical protein AB0K60_07365 [Thermopolyspora sp. NPDC052614]|uniref:hypothetical protein n=1 Tax=Thermopolyspora sp. NPDC052614 TaxID=3155682 RepID=UPI003418B986